MNTQEIVNVSVSLTAVPASQANFSVPILLVDHADVPIDRRYRTVTKSSYATSLTAATEQVGWCGALWGQNYNPTLAYIGRWVSAASPYYRVFPNAVATYATYVALTNTAKINMAEVDGTPEDIDLDFTGDTSMTDVIASINVGLAASSHYAGYVASLDKLSRVVITSDNTGDGAKGFTMGTPATGAIDLAGTSYLGYSTSFAQVGLDAEALDTALAAILAKDNTPYVVCQRGGSIAQVVAFSTAIQSRDKILLVVDDDANAKSSVATSDIGYQVEALGHQKTHLIYTEHTVNNGAAATQYPDAAVCGEIIPRPEGSASFALNALTGLSESGLDPDKTTVIPLTSDERLALEAKGYDYLINPAGIVHLRHGLAAGGNEMRVRIGMAYLAAKVAEDYYAYMLAQDVVTYSNEDITAMKSIVQFYTDILVDRKLLSEDYTITMPDQSDFTAAVKATHTMTLSNILDAPVMNSVNDVVATLAFTV